MSRRADTVVSLLADEMAELLRVHRDTPAALPDVVAKISAVMRAPHAQLAIATYFREYVDVQPPF